MASAKKSKGRRFKKAQFFLLAAFAIVTILFMINQLVSPSNVFDTSSIALSDEIFMFNNIKQKSVDVAGQSKSCEEIITNLEEFRNIAKDFVLKKGVLLFEFRLNSPCYEDPFFPIVILFDLKLSSPTANLQSSYFVPWPA